MDGRACVPAAASALEAADPDTARALLAELDGHVAPVGLAGARLDRLFGVGLRARLNGTGSGGGNPYLLDPADGASMLAAFEVLRAETPFVQFGYAAANAAIAALPAPAVHVVDIGIGRGSQWPELLDAMARRDSPPTLRLTGVDLPAPGADSGRVLREVGEQLTGLAARHALPFSYRGLPVPMEQLRADHLDLRDGETLVVNLALALHHSPTDTAHGPSVPDQMLTRLREWAPALVTLTEPDAEHDQLPLTARVREALGHYGRRVRRVGDAGARGAPGPPGAGGAVLRSRDRERRGLRRRGPGGTPSAARRVGSAVPPGRLHAGGSDPAPGRRAGAGQRARTGDRHR
jgi:hypothetical protein